MRYRYFRDDGYFIGSDVVEAASKTVAQRFKGSGMHWSEKGFSHILFIRTAPCPIAAMSSGARGKPFPQPPDAEIRRAPESEEPAIHGVHCRAEAAKIPARRRLIMTRTGIGAGLVIGAVLSLTVAEVKAVVFYATGDPGYNTNAPTGDLADSGWQYQGTFNSIFLGTPIGSKHLITAEHLTGNATNQFVIGGATYTTVRRTANPTNDLCIYEISGTFPASVIAPLYTQTDEVGKGLVVFGRGWERGSPVVVDGETNGWKYADLPLTPPYPLNTHIQRWGSNSVSGITEDSTYGSLITMDFTAGAGPDECHLGPGDSGGGVFILDGTEWRLAGVNFSISGNYNTTDTGYGFVGALSDEGGLYVGSDPDWTYVPNRPRDIPGESYATRISTSNAWISSVIPEPGLASLAFVGVAVLCAGRRWTRGRR